MKRREAIVAAYARLGQEIANILVSGDDDGIERPAPAKSVRRLKAQRPPAQPNGEVSELAAAKAEQVLRQRGIIRGT